MTSDPLPLTVTQLIEQLQRIAAKAPEAVIQVAVPRELYVIDATVFFENTDRTLEPPAHNGVVMLTLDIGKYLQREGA